MKPMILNPYKTIKSSVFYKQFIDAYVINFGTKKPSDDIIEIIGKEWTDYYRCNEYLTKEEAISMTGDIDMLMTLLNWHISGKNCFVFTQEIIDEFISKESNTENIPTEVIKLPFNHFYLKFGKHSGIEVLGLKDRYVDGCYVEKTPQGILITYTQISSDESTGSTGLSFLLRLNGADTVGEALENGLSFEKITHHKLLDSANEIGGDAPKFYHDTNANREDCKSSRDLIAPKIGRLVANCLAYILFVPDDLKETFLGAPEKLIAKYNRSVTEKEKTRNKSKLESNGYSLVKLAGKKITEIISCETNNFSSVRPHWRRGHWRLQPVGQKLSQLRITWVRPTVVRPDKGEPEFGHTYTA